MKETPLKNSAFIRSSDVKSVYADFETYADPTPSNQAVAILVKPKDGSKPYLLPMDLKAARDLDIQLKQTIIALYQLK
jgi:hypothetical protein